MYVSNESIKKTESNVYQRYSKYGMLEQIGQSRVSSGKIGRARVNTDNTDRSNTLFYVYSLLYSLLCFRQSEKILLKIQKN